MNEKNQQYGTITKQYRCAKALYFLSCLASEFDIIIDRLVDTRGHGKDVVNGMNAQDKVYLRHKIRPTRQKYAITHFLETRVIANFVSEHRFFIPRFNEICNVSRN